jgi:DNA-binding NarL/FixJ family response regulator
MTSDIIRVILADDHVVVRSGLRTILGTAKDIMVVCDASDGQQAVDAVERFKPDVEVMDLSMGGLDGIAATREIVARELPTKVLILTMHSEEEYLLSALDAGASGYLVKSAAERELVDAVRALAHGEMYVQPRAARVLTGRMKRSAPGAADEARLALLTEREREVLRLIAEGYSAPDIGQQLAISAKTVDTYKQRITDKIGVAGRPEYVRFALRVGLLTASHADSSHASAAQASASQANASHASASHAAERT